MADDYDDNAARQRESEYWEKQKELELRRKKAREAERNRWPGPSSEFPRDYDRIDTDFDDNQAREREGEYAEREKARARRRLKEVAEVRRQIALQVLAGFALLARSEELAALDREMDSIRQELETIGRQDAGALRQRLQLIVRAMKTNLKRKAAILHAQLYFDRYAGSIIGFIRHPVMLAEGKIEMPDMREKLRQIREAQDAVEADKIWVQWEIEVFDADLIKAMQEASDRAAEMADRDNQDVWLPTPEARENWHKDFLRHSDRETSLAEDRVTREHAERARRETGFLDRFESTRDTLSRTA